jgi:hypothetical protein
MPVTQARSQKKAFDELAESWDQHVDMPAILKILQLPPRKTHAVSYQLS